MEREPSLTTKEQPITSDENFIAFLIKEVPKYTIDMLDSPQGDDNTSLRKFLKNKTEGSEWTDSLGFKVRIKGGVYILEETL